MKNMLKNKNTRTDLLTYLLVIVAFVVMQGLNAGNMLGSSIKGFLIPICVYISLAVSLNLLVGICGELSLGHAGFMGIGAFTSIVVAAIAGVLLCSTVPTLMPTTGSMPGIRAFTAAVFGGIGSIPGALIGGLLLGLIEILGKAYVSTELGDALVFAVLIVVLLVKPTGLLGKKIHEKV